MSSNTARAMEERTNAGRDHAGRFKASETPRTAIDKLVRSLVPSNRPDEVVALFAGKATWHTIRDWRRGRNGTPQWAIDMIKQKLLADLRTAEQAKAGPGMKAGWRNLHGYVANKR